MSLFQIKLLGCGTVLVGDAHRPEEWKAAVAEHLKLCAKCQNFQHAVNQQLKSVGS